MGIFNFWKNWDDDTKRAAKRIAGLFILAVAIFAFLSSVSYIFTWKQDQSLLTDSSSMSVETPVHNAAGKLGYRFAQFFIGDLFGLGSFAFVVILAVAALRLLSTKWHYPLLKTTIHAIAAAFVISITLAFIASFFGADTAFGGGVGGECGAFVISWSKNLFGALLTGIFLIIIIFLWLLAVSKTFSHLLGREFSLIRKPRKEDAENDEDVIGDAVTQAPEQASAAEEAEASETASVSAIDQSEAVVAPGQKEGGVEVIQTGDDLSVDVRKKLPRIDIHDELPLFRGLSLDILENHEFGKQKVSSEELTRNNNKIRASLANYKIQVLDVQAIVGPTVTLYKVYPDKGVRIAEIKRLQDDIAMSLNAKGVRIVTLNDSVGIEVANDHSSTVPLKALLNDKSFRESEAELPVAIGYTITQKRVKVFDLADAPHLLVAGATKQGKSVGLNVIVSSLLYAKHPSELKLVFIDPKMVEFSSYAKLLKHYLAVLPDAGSEKDEMEHAIVKKAKDAEKILRSLCIEMDDRYELLSKAFVNNVKLYNEKYKDRYLLPTEGHRYMPYLVVIIDEYADLTMSVGGSTENKALSRSIQNSIIRLAQKGRAAGIHVVLATQRPSVDVITGMIKTNFPTRIAFRVASRIDSMTILDSPGAEKLIGRGDMLYYAGVEMERIQCGYVSNDEIISITDFISKQQGFKKSYNTPYYLPSPSTDEGGEGGMIDMSDLDERFEEAARMVVTSQKGSTSDLQRRLGMGYAKAGRVMDQLQAAGIVGPQEGSKPRQVLVQDLDSLEQILKAYIR